MTKKPASTKTASSSSKKLNFEQSLEKLEVIVEALESGDQSLDKALKSFPAEEQQAFKKCSTKEPINPKVTPKSYEKAQAMLKDLEEAEFITELKLYLSDRTNRINLYCLSNELSPYLKTLKEFQVFNYMHGNTASLKPYLEKGVFVSDQQNDNTVKLSASNTLIIRDTNEAKSTAPDHLLRLFAYNKIMQECGKNYFTSGNFIEEQLIDIANEAYIVSPVSSLIVLETLKDYERFGIDKNEDSLNNASTQSSGAVPEPHEWALIILLAITLGYLYYKRRTNIHIS